MKASERDAQPDLGGLLVEALQGGTSVVLATVAADGVPSTALCSWIVAPSAERIAIAVDGRSSAYKNISGGNCKVALEILADGCVLSVRGNAVVVRDQLRSVPFPCALVRVDVGDIRDHTVKGVAFQGPRYLFADGKEHRSDIERAIFAELIDEK